MAKIPDDTSSSQQILPEKTEDINEFYSFHRQIGKGTYGIVWECEHRATGTRLVCKGIPKSKLRSLKDVTEVRNEVLVMKRLAGHPHIVFLVDAFESKENVYMVMEYCTEGELFDKILKVGHYSESEAASIFHQIALAVHHCQTHHVLHRDLKPENFFLAPDAGNPPGFRVKLGDFGLAVVIEDGGKASGTSGSKSYQSPEQLSGREYDLKSDMWSLGVILYVLLSGELPFSGRTKLDIVEEIMDSGVTFDHEVWASVSEGAKSLVSRLLTLDPSHRASSSQVLEDPWLMSILPHSASLDDTTLVESPLSNLRVHPSPGGSEPSPNPQPERTTVDENADSPTTDTAAPSSAKHGPPHSTRKHSLGAFFRPLFHFAHPRARNKAPPSESSSTTPNTPCAREGEVKENL